MMWTFIQSIMWAQSRVTCPTKTPLFSYSIATIQPSEFLRHWCLEDPLMKSEYFGGEGSSSQPEVFMLIPKFKVLP